MRYGISAGTIILQNNTLLMVHHQFSPESDFWVPPGGGLKGRESIFECACRETYEETSLIVQPDRIIYIQEFVEPDYHFCKFWILCSSFTGTLPLGNLEPNETFLTEARFLSQDEIANQVAYPEILKDQFWDDLKAGFPQIRYLGLQHIAP